MDDPQKRALARIIDDLLTYFSASTDRTSEIWYKRLKTFEGTLEGKTQMAEPTPAQWVAMELSTKLESLLLWPELLNKITSLVERMTEIDAQPWRYCEKCKGEPDKLAHKMSCPFAKHNGICSCPVREEANRKLTTMFDATLKKALEDNQGLIRADEAQKIEISLLESKIRELEADNASLTTRYEMETEDKTKIAKELEEVNRSFVTLTNGYDDLLRQLNELQLRHQDLLDQHKTVSGNYNKLLEEKKEVEHALQVMREHRDALKGELARERAKTARTTPEDEIQRRLNDSWHCSQCKAGVCSVHQPVTEEEFLSLMLRDEARISRDARNNLSEERRQFVQALGFESLRLTLNRWRDLHQVK